MQSPAAFAILGPVCRGRRGALAGSAGLGVLAVLVDLARPWPLALAVDHVIAPADTGEPALFGLAPTAGLIIVGLALLTLTGALGLLDMATVVLAERAAERIGADLRRDVFDHAMSLSPRWHDRIRSGELVSRLTTDVGRLLDALVAVTITVLPDVLRIGLVLVVLVSLDAQLALVALAVVPALAVFAVRQRRRVRSVQHEARTRAGRMAAATTDLVRNVRAVQAFGRMRHAGERFGTHNRAVRDIDVRAVSVESRWTPVADVVLAVGSALVLVVGGRSVVAGRLSVGELLVVMSYLSALYSPVRSLSRLSGTLAKSEASAARISEVLDCGERIVDRPDALRVPMTIDEISFHDVDFAYRADRPVLRGFELTIRAGETVALVGPSGCGKSTVLSLLLRMYDVDSGSIRLDGHDIRDLRHGELRRRIAYVPQDAWLLDATIAENIGFAAPSASRHEVLQAGRTALVDEIAAGKPHGYDSPVGENGGQLSGGQRRRIALARAVASDAPVVLLDEPTASLDPAAAGVLVDAIRRATAGRTVLLVTHDPELAATADRVVTLHADGAHGVALDRPGRVPNRVDDREEVPS